MARPNSSFLLKDRQKHLPDPPRKIMLDRDLAFQYGVEAKVLNHAVKRNLQRFPSDFMLQLTAERG
jgi:hypothetical protein